MEKREVDNTVWDFDKLRDVVPEGGVFEMECGFCRSKDIDIKPFNIAWKTDSDNSDLPPKLRKGFDALPNRIEAILLGAQQHSIYFECSECKTREFVTGYIDRLKLTKWLHKKYGKK